MKTGLSLVFLFLLLAAATGQAAESQIVAGAGPSTGLVKSFFSAFSRLPEAAGTSFNVMDTSVKHAGGVKNADTFLFGRSGRPLNDEEKAGGKREILLGRVQIGFGRGLEAGVKSLPMAKVKDIFTRKVANWKQVGGSDAPILLLGREPSEAVFSELREQYPWFRDVTFDQVFKKDDDLLKFLASPQGRHAIAFGVKSQFPEAQALEVADLRAGLKVGLIYDQKNENHPLVQAAKRFGASKEWRALVLAEGFTPLR